MSYRIWNISAPCSQIKREFPEWTIVDIVPMHQLSKRNLDDVDFVISTVNLDLKDKLHIVVSVLLMENDINNIKMLYFLNLKKYELRYKLIRNVFRR